ncbi:MAG TPA: carboxypeptidase regulatory-like domain-containing protein [Pyrinomonadaceae bacterium]|jgi:hypothetical protein
MKEGKLKIMMRSILFLLITICWTATLAQSPSPYTVTGELRNDTGQLLSGAKVCAIPTNGKIVRVRDRVCADTDTQGKFVIDLNEAGSYQVIAEKRSEGYNPVYIPYFRDPKVAINEIAINDQNRNPSLSITIGPKSGLISGKVVDEATDKPVQNFTVWVWQARDHSARYHEVAKGVHSGRFKLFAPPVPFQLRVTAEGYEDWVMGGGVLTSLAGSRKGPGTLLVRSDGNAEFAVYLKSKNPISVVDQRDATRLPAPVQLSPKDNEVFDYFPRKTRLTWNLVAGALAYGVEVEACWKPSPVQQSRLPDDNECINPSPYDGKFRLTETNYEVFFKGAQPGRWRVWAVDSNHHPGVKSPWRRFVYLK